MNEKKRTMAGKRIGNVCDSQVNELFISVSSEFEWNEMRGAVEPRRWNVYNVSFQVDGSFLLQELFINDVKIVAKMSRTKQLKRLPN